MTSNGGAQTRRREASMLVMKKRVLANLHIASFVEAMEIQGEVQFGRISGHGGEKEEAFLAGRLQRNAVFYLLFY